MKVTFGKIGNTRLKIEEPKRPISYLPLDTEYLRAKRAIEKQKKVIKGVKIAGLAALAGLLATAGVFFAKTAQENNDKKEVRQTEIVENNDTSVNSSVKKK